MSFSFSHYLKGAHEGFVNTHHAACVVELPTVVWSGEKCDQLAFGKELVSILHNLQKHTWHYSTASSDRYQGTDLRQASVRFKRTKPPTPESKQYTQHRGEIANGTGEGNWRLNHGRGSINMCKSWDVHAIASATVITWTKDGGQLWWKHEASSISLPYFQHLQYIFILWPLSLPF